MVIGTKTSEAVQALDASLNEDLEALRRDGLFRPLRVLESAQGPEVEIAGKAVISLSSNNYLGLNTHPRLVEAASRAALEWGAGHRRGAHHRGNADAAPGAGAPARGVQAHRGVAHVPERLRGERRRHRLDARPGRLRRQRQAEPRQHHRRHPAHEGRAHPVRARRSGRRRARAAARRAARDTGASCW